MRTKVQENITFVQSTIEDIDAIFGLYDDAIAFQKTVFKRNWQGFERALIEKEISEGRQWKMISEGEIACIFAIDFNDPVIWGLKDNDPSIYLHRIVTDPFFRGNNHVSAIIEWALEFGKSNKKQYIRMDTWGDNPNLIAYYVKCGFNHIGFTTPENFDALPKHYENISLALFEIPIP